MIMRNQSIDTISGLMILLVLYRHCLIATTGFGTSLIGSAITYYPLLFYMAWFFFKSGMFFKADERFEDTVKKGFVRLIVPYLCFSLIAIVISLSLNGILYGSKGIHEVLSDIPLHLKREGAVVCNSPLWFLLSLFCARIFFSAANRLHIPTWCTAIVSLGFAFGLYRMDLPIGLYFENIALGLFFFSMGSIFKELQYNNAVFITSAILYVAFLIYSFATRSVISEFIINTHTPYIPTVAFCLAGCLFIDNLFKRIGWLNGKWLSNIGKDSMTFYVTHFIIINIIVTLDKAVFHLLDWPLFLLLIIVLAITMPLCARIFAKPGFKWMIGDAPQCVKAIRLSPVIAWCGVVAVTVSMLAYLILQF